MSTFLNVFVYFLGQDLAWTFFLVKIVAFESRVHLLLSKVATLGLGRSFFLVIIVACESLVHFCFVKLLHSV